MMRNHLFLVFFIFLYASALDIFIDDPILLLDCRTHVSEEPVEYTKKFNSTEEPEERTTKSQTTGEPMDPIDFYFAARDGDLGFIATAISQLSTSGLDLNWRNTDDYGPTALYIATENDHSTIVAALLDAGADPDVQDDFGLSPVWVAAREGHTGVLEQLLGHGVDPNRVNNDGTSPLQAASAFGQVEAARTLIRAGAHVGYVRPSDGFTALHRAAYYNRAVVALLLLQNGAQKDKLSKYRGYRLTPADVAKEQGHDSVAQLIDNY